MVPASSVAEEQINAQTKERNGRILLGALAIILLRSPILLWHGRVAAEEGTVYLQHAWTASLSQTLLMVHQGYYSLLLNLLSMLNARVFPLEWAGETMVIAALAILLLTAWLAINCEALPDHRSRCFAAAICVLTPSIEVWGTAEDAQFVLSLATALICLSVADRHRLVRSGMLVLAALSGPVSCVFAPLFLLRAYRQRSVWSGIQAGLMLFCSAAQGLVLLGSIRSGTRSLAGGGKDAWFGPVLVLKIFAVEFFTRLGAFAAQRLAVPHPTPIVRGLFWILFLLFLTLFVKMAKMGGETGWQCLTMALVSLAFNYQGIAESAAVIRIGAFRYFFTGYALFSLVLVAAYARANQKEDAKGRKLALVLVLITLTTGTIDAVGYWMRFQAIQPEWRGQVAAWRRDPHLPIRVYPPGWTNAIHLDPK